MKFKKIISLILCCFMVLPIVSYASDLNVFQTNRTYADNFSDVNKDDWFYENVKKAYELELVNGTSEITFGSNESITIAETITLACRIYNIYNETDYKFETSEPWYQSYVDFAIDNKIITQNGYSDYDAQATRLQFVNIMYKALPEKEFNTINNVEKGVIPDVESSEEVYSLYNAGIISGNDKYGSFAPDSTIKRNEVSAIVTRMVDKSLRKEFVLEKAQFVTMYAPDGRTQEVMENNIDYEKQNGWYLVPVQTLYALDGRSQVFDKTEVDSQLTVGWYTEPSQILYAPDGRTQIVAKNNVAAQLAVGWYEYPVQTLYASNGRSQVVAKSDVPAQLATGWSEYIPASYYSSYAESSLSHLLNSTYVNKIMAVYVKEYGNYVLTGIIYKGTEVDVYLTMHNKTDGTVIFGASDYYESLVNEYDRKISYLYGANKIKAMDDKIAAGKLRVEALKLENECLGVYLYGGDTWLRYK